MTLSFRLLKVLLVSAIFLFISHTYALADAKDERIDALEKQMLVMMEEIKALKAERAEEKKQQQALRDQIQNLESNTAAQIEQKIADIAPAAGSDIQESDVDIAMDGGAPKFTKGNFSWQPFGRIHLDAGAISDDARDHSNGAEFRRARLGMQGNVAKNFGYKAEIDFANEGVNIQDMYMNYTGFDNAEIRLGHFNPGYSLEDMTSSNDITFIERASVVDSFEPSRKIGAGVITHGENWTATIGAFNGDAGTNSSDDEEWSVAGRLTGTPVKNSNGLVHIGASAAYREPDQANDRFDLDATAENRIQSVDSVSSVINDGESLTVMGVEAAAVSGPFSIQGEYLAADIENRGGQDPFYQGAYGQIAWTLTGESRSYSGKKGAFGGIKPARPLDPSKGDWGAVELAARFSHLDLNDNGLNGGEMNNTTFGANWYLNNYMRLMANVILVDTDGNATTPDDDPTVTLIRSQVKF